MGAEAAIMPDGARGELISARPSQMQAQVQKGGGCLTLELNCPFDLAGVKQTNERKALRNKSNQNLPKKVPKQTIGEVCL